jgi:hypothetical protein
MENTIETSCGDIVQISCIDSVGKVVECKFSEPVYRKILFWDIHAARNVKLFGSTKRAECLEQDSADSYASAALKA